ncbi:MAG: biopolymer transporter ExbD [Cytophagaceae bacterium]|jgi:biopolymer transport protein ExbD|nr:biopolymer transporter ExbD [Cytophagaceae bacterium]
MQLKRRNKITTEFNMSSMTDLVFLLLIFFLLTSTFVTPSALPVSLPSTDKEVNTKPTEIAITISKDLRYLVGNKESSLSTMENDIKASISGDIKNTFVTLHVDKDVPTEYFVKVASICNSLGLKVSLATVTEK